MILGFGLVWFEESIVCGDGDFWWNVSLRGRQMDGGKLLEQGS